MSWVRGILACRGVPPVINQFPKGGLFPRAGVRVGYFDPEHESPTYLGAGTWSVVAVWLRQTLNLNVAPSG